MVKTKDDFFYNDGKKSLNVLIANQLKCTRMKLFLGSFMTRS